MHFATSVHLGHGNRNPQTLSLGQVLALQVPAANVQERSQVGQLAEAVQ